MTLDARGNDRRGRARVALQCQVQLSRAGNGSVLTSVTRDVSSAGFYCLSSEMFVPGERLDCTLVIPTPLGGFPEERLCLQCRVEVTRVEPLGAGGSVGIACQIVDYSVIRLVANLPAPAEARSSPPPLSRIPPRYFPGPTR
jgi:hypothetical protein